jgi:two-component SAPR family response regulator
LWPNRLEEEVTNVFHVTLHRLRRALEPERARGSSYIQRHLGRHGFDFSSPHELDATRFALLVAADEEYALQEAVGLYRGEYLQDLYWALPAEAETERRHLECLYERALRRLAFDGDGTESKIYLERLVQIIPADEGVNQALVEIYLEEGRQDLAERQLERWRNFAQELSPELPSKLD